MRHLGWGNGDYFPDITGAARAEGWCQASYSLRTDGYLVLQCLHPACNFNVQGFDADLVVEEWNDHVRFRGGVEQLGSSSGS